MKKSKLKKGDRVTVKMANRQAFNGRITGEGRGGLWWLVLKDGNVCPTCYHKDFCQPEAVLVSNGKS